jgi:hypothetical protein
MEIKKNQIYIFKKSMEIVTVIKVNENKVALLFNETEKEYEVLTVDLNFMTEDKFKYIGEYRGQNRKLQQVA